MACHVRPVFIGSDTNDMLAARQKHTTGERPVPVRADLRLVDLAGLGAVDIETPLVGELSGDLHALFDHVSEGALPIYFGPLLGRLYLEGL